MLKLTVHPGEYIQIGDNVKVIMAGRSSNNIYVMVDAPREISVVRSTLLEDSNSYYVDEKLSDEAVREIKRIISKSKAESRAKRESSGEATDTASSKKVAKTASSKKTAKTVSSKETVKTASSKTISSNTVSTQSTRTNRRQSAPDKEEQGRKQA